ncbi:MAG: hypothetical protein ACE5GH_03030, partial [Fidelibacterota bacterium]
MMTGVRPQSQFDISPLDYYHYFRRDVEERTVTYLLGFLLSVTFLWGERPFTQTTKGIPGGLTRRLADVEHTVWDGNEISTWHGNHGDWVSYHSAGRPGLEWPKGSGKWAGFQSGLWLGSGRVRTPGSDWLEETRTAAVQYTSEFVPGTISGEGGHIYEIHRAELNAFLENDFSEFKRMTAELPLTEGNQRVMTTVSFPTPDFENWPAHLGAPWVDANGDGAYHIEDGDHPDILGDQFHWYVMNDADTTAHRALWETAPMNVEVQTSLFGFDQSGPLGDVLFIRSVIINRGSEDLDSVFVSFWHDDDVGGSEDDLVACDTTLDLGYTYNDADGDDVYGVEVPAVGSDLFQGPVVYSEGDTASLLTWDLESGYHLKDVPDRRQLPMTSFVKYIRGDAVFHDPFTALEAYRSMNGLIGSSGRPFVNPLTGRPTNFVHAGDPVVGTGWLDGGYTPPGDRRYLLTSGPFQLAQGDTQEVVGGIIVGGGSTWERSIRKLKYFDKFAQGIFDGGFSICSPPGPTVTVAAMDKKIVLTFQEDSESIENYTCSDYRFEGYNIYQGESPNGPWHRLATYDVVNGVKVILDLVLDDATGELIEVPAQFGTDSGLQYYLEITYDEVNGRELINYRSYYY